MFPLHCGNDPGRDFLTSARTTAWLTRSPYEYLGNAVLIFCLMCSWSRPGFFSLYPWIYSSFQTSIIWERQGAMLVKVFSWECNLLHILCTGLSLASIMTTFHFISAHFIGCGCVLCPTVVLEDLKESLKWRSLTSRNFQPVPFCHSSNFLYTYKNAFLMVASMYIFRWVCWSWQHYYILIAWCSCS